MGEAKDIQDYKEIFPNGTIVTHILGGRGKIKTLENDWSTNPPTVIALVEVMDTMDTMFPGIQSIPVIELTPMTELSKETLEKWKKEALGFKGDIEDMKDAEPILELIDRFLLTLQELQSAK